MLRFLWQKRVNFQGEVITTDMSSGNIAAVAERNIKENLNIKTFLLPSDNPLLGEKHNSYFDAIVTMATLHHFDNRKKATGERGRIQALHSFFQNLKKGGRLVIADPLHNTITQEYFDAIDNPTHCHPDGHPHDFFSENRLLQIVNKIGFRDVSLEISYVPWHFMDVDEAKHFMHTMHNAQCSQEESFEIARNILDFKKINGHYELGWELFFLVARK
ncbi:MAG TPA: methyltransferase domain-containing protein [Patescibacteria group bacterium]|nr:methyltransferase domain-containing protein [Patescibacteria group bacterium]